MTFNRRTFLGGALAAPFAARKVVAEAAGSMSLAGMSVLPASRANAPSPAGMEKVTFRDFGKWLTAHGEQSIRRRAKQVDYLDPDLLEMCCPLHTKVRMQRARNYVRLLEEQRSWFDERLSSKGFVDWYP